MTANNEAGTLENYNPYLHIYHSIISERTRLADMASNPSNSPHEMIRHALTIFQLTSSPKTIESVVVDGLNNLNDPNTTKALDIIFGVTNSQPTSTEKAYLILAQEGMEDVVKVCNFALFKLSEKLPIVQALTIPENQVSQSLKNNNSLGIF